MATVDEDRCIVEILLKVNGMELTDQNKIETADLSDLKNSVLADYNLFISTAFVGHDGYVGPRPKEMNKRMKDRKKKKKLDLQYNRQNIPSLESNSRIQCGQFITQLQEHSCSRLEKGVSTETQLSYLATDNFKRVSKVEYVDTDIQIERQKLLESWSPRPSITFDHRFIVAPMINQSDPPFRTLCLKYGATCAYTEMLYSHRIVDSENYLCKRLQVVDHSFFRSSDECTVSSTSFKTKRSENRTLSNRLSDPEGDREGRGDVDDRSTRTEQSEGDKSQTFKSYSSRPLIVQICGNDPDILSKAVTQIKEYSKLCPVDAIDFNLGCPQDRAKEGIK